MGHAHADIARVAGAPASVARPIFITHASCECLHAHGCRPWIHMLHSMRLGTLACLRSYAAAPLGIRRGPQGASRACT